MFFRHGNCLGPALTHGPGEWEKATMWRDSSIVGIPFRILLGTFLLFRQTIFARRFADARSEATGSCKTARQYPSLARAAAKNAFGHNGVRRRAHERDAVRADFDEGEGRRVRGRDGPGGGEGSESEPL